MLKKLVIFLLMIGGVIAGSSESAYSEVKIDTSSSFLYPGYSKKISMDFQDAALVDVLKIFSQQTNLNLITSEELATKHVTVYLDNVPIEQALEQVLRANNLTYELQPDSNIYIVKPMSKPDVEILTRVYILKHASVSTARIKKTLKIIYTADKETTTTVTEDDNAGSSSSDNSAPGILNAIKGVLTTKGKAVEDPRTNSITITDIASNFSNIENAVAKLDIAIPQVLIEVEMLEVSKENADKIGVKYGDTPLTFSGAQRFVLYPFNQNLLKTKGFSIESGSEYTSGIVDASGMTAVLQFLTTQSDTKNLARPRILTLSNQPAQIKISTNEATQISNTTTSSQNLATASADVVRTETGVFLTVTPQVDSIDRQITMAVVPKVITTRVSTLSSSGQPVKDPEERGSLSILRVKDGDTVVIGGLLREDRTTTTTKFPFLGDIPLLGAAFRHKSDTLQNRELIIFLTPHILDADTPASATNATPPIFREQSQPTNRFTTVERELSTLQNKKL